jgi:hypothetical protein
MPQAAWVMFCITPKPTTVWNRESDCQPSYAHRFMLVEGLGS